MTPSNASIVAAYWADRQPTQSMSAEREAALAERLTQAHAAGARVWPDVHIPLLDYTRHLGARVEPALEPADAIDRVQHADLYIACGCALGLPRAVAAFERTFVARVPAYTHRVRLTPEARDDVIAKLRERLLVPREGGRPPRVADYAGRGSFEGWVRATVVRIALDAARDRADPSAPGADDGELERIADTAPELADTRARYQAQFQAALEDAVASLGEDERTLLRLYFVDRLRVEQIGRLWRLDKSNVSRRLARARARVLEATQALLAERLGLEGSAFGSVLQAVRGELRLSMTRLLGGGTPKP